MGWTARAGRAAAVAALSVTFATALALPSAATTSEVSVRGVPTIDARPSTDLVDGQKIILVLSGFPANHVVGVTQCGIPAGYPEVCDFANGFNVKTNYRGFARTEFTVRQKWAGTDPWTGEVLTDVDCKVTACTAAAASPTQPTTGDIVPISFRPDSFH
jgi:hypothetical protein